MSDGDVRLTIDGRPVTVPAGTLIVDAAKKAGIDIPVFCYHPKLEPVGMCRMCLVEIGRPARDRTTGEVPLDEKGNPVLFYNVKLETACTTPVGEGWNVRVVSDKALAGRKEVVEFLLTSHPLDCPICDKGGECPLQNLTLGHGPGTSRFVFDDKIHLQKRVPLGDLITLDRERCIQCARCIRFQEEIAGDPVIGFYERGRKLEIVTFSEPGFDSYFSGNTTDICPVGALTTTDFRFGARPWELNAAASICPHCPVGCNLTLNTRREAESGGAEVIKRVMPRQNEQVNETWICDKGRFAHHYASSPTRIQRPLVRREGQLVEVPWDEALQAAADGLRAAGPGVRGIAGGRLSNEDLFVFRRTVEAVGGSAMIDSRMNGGDFAAHYGLGRQADLGRLGRGDAILVVGADLHEEAPVWWLRVKQAAQRGASLIVAHPRPTRLDEAAAHHLVFEHGRSVEAILGLASHHSGKKELERYGRSPEMAPAANAIAEAQDLVIFFGGEGLDGAGTRALAEACGSLLATTGHAGKPNSGLVAVWPRANDQGAWDLGLRPADDVGGSLRQAKAAYLAACDPLGDDPSTQPALDSLSFLVVQDLYLTATAERAHVVLPAQSFVEREGSLTTGEGRVQRFYPAVPPLGETRPDWWIAGALGARLGASEPPASAADCMEQIAAAVPAYAQTSYAALAEVHEQWPLVGGEDLYFGGTAYANHQGLGVKRPTGIELGNKVEVAWPDPPAPAPGSGLLFVPVYRLYDRGTTVLPSMLLEPHRSRQQVELNPADAHSLGIADGDRIAFEWDSRTEMAEAAVVESVPAGIALVPRSSGVNLLTPARGRVRMSGQGADR
jgi:NADH-quinone oxidoreductase subunit G